MSAKICLDAGHYAKYNQSPVNKAYWESDMTWKLHRLLKTELESYGFAVVTTRTTQEKDVEVYKRGTLSKGCDLFLSLHSNASTSEQSNYALACCQIEQGNRSVYQTSDEVGNLLAECVNKTMGCTGKHQILKRVGNNGDYYGVLRGAKAVGTPGVLLEHGFHTNKSNTEWLLNENNLKALATAESAALAQYFNLSKDSTATPTSQATNASTFSPYVVRIICNSLNIRKTPKWEASDIVGTVKKNEAFTIVGECYLGSTKFGKLKSGAGFISLGEKYVKRV